MIGFRDLYAPRKSFLYRFKKCENLTFIIRVLHLPLTSQFLIIKHGRTVHIVRGVLFVDITLL